MQRVFWRYLPPFCIGIILCLGSDTRSAPKASSEAKYRVPDLRVALTGHGKVYAEQSCPGVLDGW